MKVAVYARVSTSDRDQNVDTQLLPLRDFCTAQGWEIVGEYVDRVLSRLEGHAPSEEAVADLDDGTTHSRRSKTDLERDS